jgi:cation diffusion facilitator family transporter
VNAKSPTALAERNRKVRLVLWAILLANWLVAAGKLALGVYIDSTAMTADGLHSFIDGASNVIGLIAMHFASQPADDEHPYGHQKFEALAALAIGVMIGIGVLELGKMAFAAIVRNVRPEVTPAAIAMMVATLVINLFVTRIEKRQGEQLNSTLLIADAQHTLSDVFVTATVISSLVLSWLGVGRADGVVALAVLVFVAWTGWGIIKQSAGILADTVRIDPSRVRAACASIPDVLEVHGVRSRGMEGSVYVDLKIDVDPQLTIARAHSASDAVEQAIGAAFPEVIDVVVHVEPRA